MRPAYAGSLEKGAAAVEFEVGYQNTWALSPNVEKYLTGLESQGRRELGPAELQAIRDLPGEGYLVDLESATLDVIVHYKFAEHWTGYLIASGVSYQGGFLDRDFLTDGRCPWRRQSRCRWTELVSYSPRATSTMGFRHRSSDVAIVTLSTPMSRLFTMAAASFPRDRTIRSSRP